MYLGRNPAVGTQRMLDSLESQFNGTLTTFDLRYGGVPTYPTLSESLIVSLGGVLQEPGEAYYVSSDKIVFSEAPNAGTECWILLYSQYGAAASSTPSLAIQATGEPMGFENRTHSTISFNSGTRTFSIAPNTSGGYSSYVVWTKGTKRTITTTLSVQVGTTTGLYYIYFDAFGDLQYKTTYFTWDTETPVAYVYLNASSLPTAVAPFVADERHGVVLDWQTHEYLHRTRGAVIAEGFSISPHTAAGTGTGNADGDARFDLGNGTFFDEDLEVNITHSASPTVGTFTQILQDGAEIPVFYMKGPAGAWLNDPATKFACKQSGTTLQYNSYVQGQWSTTPADNNRYVISWIVATNDITAPVICILGQAQYTNIGSAEAIKFGNLTLTNFPIVEFRPLWKVIFQTSTGFTNTPNALIARILDLRQLSETGEAGTVVSDHGLLSGLTDDDHAQYLHTTLTRTGVTAEFNTTGKITTTSNIGIGIVNPSYNLQVGPGNFANIAGRAGVAITADSEVFGTYGTGGDLVLRAQRPIDGGGGSVVLGGSARGDFRINSVLIRTADTDRIFVNSSGNIGVGTTSPDVKFHVWNGQTKINARDKANTGTALALSTTDASQRMELLFDHTTNNYWRIQSVEQNVAYRPLVLQNDGGNVGIGITNPAVKLDVAGEISASSVVRTNSNRLVLRDDSIENHATDTDTAAVVVNYFGYGSGATRFRDFYVYNGKSGFVLRTVGSTGNVGIGTTDPATKLDVVGAIRAEKYQGVNSLVLNSYQTVNPSSNVFLYSQPNDRDSWIYLDSADTGSNWGIYHRQIDTEVLELPRNSIGFVGGGNSALKAYISLQSGNAYFSGNVGIGTTNPTYSLYVRTSSSAAVAILESTQSNGDNVQLRFKGTNGEKWAIGNNVTTGGTGTNFDIFDLVSNTGRFRIDSNGNVGIGITNPQTRLGVYSGSDDDGLTLEIGRTPAGGEGPALTFRHNTNNGASQVFAKIKSRMRSGNDTSWSSDLSFYTGGNALTENFTINNVGNVGIGTTNPSSALHSYGDRYALFGPNSGWGAFLRIGGNGNLPGVDHASIFTTNGNLHLDALTSSGTYFNLYRGTSGIYFGDGAGGFTGRFTGSGNLGIGTTTPGERLIVYSNANSASQVRHQNASSGSDAFAAYRLSSDAPNSVWWWLNSSTRAVDGGVNTSTIRNDAGDMRLQAGGEVGLHIKATTGNIGIGTANPEARVSIWGSDSHIIANESGTSTAWRSRIISRNSGANKAAFMGVYASSPGIFAHDHSLSAWDSLYVNTTNGSSDGGNVVIAGSGSVGIGTNSPVEKLELRGAADTNPTMLFHHAGIASYKMGVHGAVLKIAAMDNGFGGHNGSFTANNSQVISLNNMGRVGIGTTNPQKTLHIYSSSPIRFEDQNRQWDINIKDGKLVTGDNTGSADRFTIDTSGNVGIGLTNPAYKLEVSGRSNFNDNMKITPTSEAWAEGLQFYMPNTYTWGGLRWVRNRSNFHGSWYQGWTALDSSNDMVFGHNASGTQVDNILRLYGSASGSARIGRDLYIAGHTGGNYGNRLVVGATDTAYTLQDGNFRPTIQAHGGYPVISLNHTITSNINHGPTLQFTCDGVGHQFVIGTTGNGTRLDIGFSTTGDWNPHNGISNYQGTTSMSFTTSGNVGIGTLSPAYKLEVNGSFAATTKSFIIPHPTKEGYKLRHGSLEGPENGVYVRGKNNSAIIELPEYWTGLINPDSITINLTPIGQNSQLWVEKIEGNKVYIGREDSSMTYFYIAFAERIDVDPLEIEILDS
jgi:hypothetical protein